MLVHLLQLAMYSAYFKKKYYWVNFNATPNFDAIKQKTAFLIHQISLLIFSSTDTLVISIAGKEGLVYASIYTTYNMIVHALHKICSTINNSLLFMLGITFHEDNEEYIKLHDAYNTYYITFIFSVLSVCYLLFRPFILLYTKKYDFNYDLPYLPLLFCLVQLLSSIRMVSGNLINIAGHAKATVPRTIIEAAINLVVSLTLVWSLGLYGVLLGTIVALLYRANDIIIYTSKKILKRSCYKAYKPVVINFVLFGLVVMLERLIGLELGNFGAFILYGIVYGVTVLPAHFIINSLFAPAEFKYVFNIVKGKLVKK
jgi:O-antigen/teichoic acid export membrane protein